MSRQPLRAASAVAVIFRVCPRRREVRDKVRWLLSLLPNGIKMNVEAVGLNKSLNFGDYK